MNISDKEDVLAQAAQMGDHNAFATLLDLHLPHVRTFLALKAPVPQLVDEIAHDTFVFAFRHLDEFQPGTSFRAWVRAIAWNLLRAEVQRFAREQVNQEKFTEWQLVEWETSSVDSNPSAEAERNNPWSEGGDSPQAMKSGRVKFFHEAKGFGRVSSGDGGVIQLDIDVNALTR